MIVHTRRIVNDAASAASIALRFLLDEFDCAITGVGPKKKCADESHLWYRCWVKRPGEEWMRWSFCFRCNKRRSNAST